METEIILIKLGIKNSNITFEDDFQEILNIFGSIDNISNNLVLKWPEKIYQKLVEKGYKISNQISNLKSQINEKILNIIHLIKNKKL